MNVTNDEGREVVEESQNYYFGAVMGLVAALSRAFVFVCTKKLCQNKTSNSPILITFHMSLTSLLFNLFMGMISQDTPKLFSGEEDLRMWLVYLVIAVLGSANLILSNIALKLVSPILVSFTRSADIVVGYAIQVLFFHQAVNNLAITGSFLIVAAIGILQLEAWVHSLLPTYIRFLC